MLVGKNDEICPSGQNESPGVAASGDSSIGWLSYTLSVQPLANIVSNYTCSDG